MQNATSDFDIHSNPFFLFGKKYQNLATLSSSLDHSSNYLVLFAVFRCRLSP